MFIPFTENEIDIEIANKPPYVARDVTTHTDVKKYYVCNKDMFAVKHIAMFQLLDHSDPGCIVNFSLHKDREGCLSKYRHLYLIMALRCVRKWSISNGAKLLTIHTEDPLMPEIFLNEGLTLRRAPTSTKPLYRGSLRIKE
ncbi:MAG TPA: hypothetical protein VI911_06890 [Patescibacteria group bacterium]|nr:hypothetical protein [Patescibacteria group bacterium]